MLKINYEIKLQYPILFIVCIASNAYCIRLSKLCLYYLFYFVVGLGWFICDCAAAILIDQPLFFRNYGTLFILISTKSITIYYNPIILKNSIKFECFATNASLFITGLHILNFIFIPFIIGI